MRISTDIQVSNQHSLPSLEDPTIGCDHLSKPECLEKKGDGSENVKINLRFFPINRYSFPILTSSRSQWFIEILIITLMYELLPGRLDFV
jgi:hypothetical protein